MHQKKNGKNKKKQQQQQQYPFMQNICLTSLSLLSKVIFILFCSFSTSAITSSNQPSIHSIQSVRQALIQAVSQRTQNEQSQPSVVILPWEIAQFHKIRKFLLCQSASPSICPCVRPFRLRTFAIYIAFPGCWLLHFMACWVGCIMSRNCVQWFHCRSSFVPCSPSSTPSLSLRQKTACGVVAREEDNKENVFLANDVHSSEAMGEGFFAVLGEAKAKSCIEQKKKTHT